jgi:hypothetical protein
VIRLEKDIGFLVRHWRQHNAALGGGCASGAAITGM